MTGNMAETTIELPTDSIEIDAYDVKLNEILTFLKGDEIGAVVDFCDQLIRINGQRPEAFAILGIVAYNTNDVGRALQMFETAHDLDPDCRDYAEVLGTLSARTGRLADGVFYAKLATALDHNPFMQRVIPHALQDFASALASVSKSPYHIQAQRAFAWRDFKDAADLALRHLQVEREDEPVYRLLARSLLKLGEFDQATSALHTAIHLRPGEAQNYAYLALSLNGLGKVDEAMVCAERARSLAPGDIKIHALVMQVLVSAPNDSWPRFGKAAKAWNARHATPRAKRKGHKYDPAAGRPIRIGYIAAGFNTYSPEAAFLAAVLSAHDKSRFEVFGYQPFWHEDATTYAMENLCTEWIKLKDIDSYTAALIIENDQCDVLIDCTGFEDENRLDVLQQRPAPVQICWLNHGEGAGVPGADYLISDDVLIAVDEKACPKDQKPLVLANGCMALMPFSMVDEAGPLPALENGFVTFGAIADLTSISTNCISRWCSALRDVPGSRIVFGYVEKTSETVKERIIDMFSHMGMADRVLFHEPDESKESGSGLFKNRQEFFSLIDVFFDAAPVSSPLAVAHAMWMGVPAICVNAGRRSARMGASALASAGCEDWIAKTDDGFVKIVNTLSVDIKGLAEVRKTLRAEIEKTSLFDPRSFARRLEDVFQSVLHK